MHFKISNVIFFKGFTYGRPSWNRSVHFLCNRCLGRCGLYGFCLFDIFCMHHILESLRNCRCRFDFQGRVSKEKWCNHSYLLLWEVVFQTLNFFQGWNYNISWHLFLAKEHYFVFVVLIFVTTLCSNTVLSTLPSRCWKERLLMSILLRKNVFNVLIEGVHAHPRLHWMYWHCREVNPCLSVSHKLALMHSQAQ